MRFAAYIRRVYICVLQRTGERSWLNSLATYSQPSLNELPSTLAFAAPRGALVKIIKHDFGLTINIEDLINKIDSDGSGEIEFAEFKALLS